MYLISRYSSMPYLEPSLPNPDCFQPPNGAISEEMIPSFTPTIPTSIASATRQIWLISCEKKYPGRDKGTDICVLGTYVTTTGTPAFGKWGKNFFHCVYCILGIYNLNLCLSVKLREQRWRSGESPRLQPMWIILKRLRSVFYPKSKCYCYA